MSVLIDTLAAQRNLEAAGFDRAQADAIVEAFAHTADQVATKADIRRLEVEVAEVKTGLKTEIDGVKTEIAAVKTQVAALETKLEAKIDAKISAASNRLLAALVAVGGLLFAALRIF